MHKTRVGFWGTGNWARRLAAAAQKIDSIEAVACWGANTNGDAEFASQFACEAAPTEESFLSTDGLDAVIITTPNALHREHACQALKLGLNVFLEKPAAIDPSESAAILASAQASERVCMVGHNHRRETRARMIKHLLADKAIGRPLLAHIFYTSRAGLMGEVGAWRFDPKQCPALALAQIGVHAIDTLNYLFGRPVRVNAMIRSAALDPGVEDLCTAQFEFADGVLATLTNGYSVRTERRITILGTEGALDSPSPSEFVQTGVGAEPPKSTAIDPNDTLVEELTEFEAAIRGKAKIETGAAEGHAVVAIFDALRRSSAEGRFVQPDYSALTVR